MERNDRKPSAQERERQSGLVNEIENHSLSRFFGFHMTTEVMLEYKASPFSVPN